MTLSNVQEWLVSSVAKNRARTVVLGSTGLFILVLPWLNFRVWNNPLMMQHFMFIGVGLLLSVGLLAGLATGFLRLPQTKLTGFIVALVGAKLLSTLFSAMPLRSIWGSYIFMADSFLFLVCLCVFGAFLLSLRPSERLVRTLLRLLFVQGVLISCLSLWEATGMRGGENIRVTTLLANSDYFISYILLVAPLGWAVMTESWRSERIVAAVLCGVGLLACLAALFYTLPPGLQNMLTGHKGTTSAGGTVTSFLTNDSNNERFNQWEMGLQIGLDHPIVGSGPGMTRLYFYEKVKDIPEWNHNAAMDMPHNDLIQQFSQGGILGLASYVALWVSYFMLVLKRRRQVPTESKLLFTGILVGLGLFLLFNQVLFTVQITAIMVAIVTGASLVLSRSVSYGKVATSNGGWQAACVAAVILVPLVGYWGWRYTRAEAAAATAWGNRDLQVSAAKAQEAIALYPYEENYFALSSGYQTDVALRDTTRANASFRRSRAEIARALELNHFVPKFRLNQGIITYVSSVDPTEEQQAAEQIAGALAELPWNKANYTYVTQVVVAKSKPEIAEYLFTRMSEIAPSEEIKTLVVDLKKQYTDILAARAAKQ